MIDPELLLILETPGCVAVLQAYRTAELSHRQITPIGLQTSPVSDHEGAESAEHETESGEEADAAEEPSAEGAGRTRRPNPWLPRIAVLESLTSAELSQVHGTLIAYGMLKCELGDREEGVLYQLTVSGKQVLNLAANTTVATQPCLAVA